MPSRALAAVLAVLAFTACNSARKLESSASASACTRCHGDPARPDGSPPQDLHGDDRTTSISVGAHASHLTGSHGIAAPVRCEACHVVPAPGAAGHPDGRLEILFGAVARPGGAPASWNRADATCTVYCHGATLPGGAAPPVWTRVDGTQVACDRCHGNPPARPHPQRSDCRTCHPATVDERGGIDVAGGRHVDGVVERELHGCTDCHGDAARAGDDPLLRAAPPSGAGGERATTERAVGAHQAHLVAGDVSRPVACAECHVVPAAPDHSDGVAGVAFGPLATRGGSAAAWDREAATCSGTYCHGATLGGGLGRTPVWTRVDGTQRGCDACHGAPPPPPHPSAATCSTCHPGTVRADGSIDVANGLHLNGEIDSQRWHASGWREPSAHGRAANADLAGCRGCHGADLGGGAVGVSCDACHPAGWRTTCTFCHGDPNRAASAAAPPLGTQGETSPGAAAVGAHAAHLTDGPLRKAIACEECHAVPVDLSHVDGVRALAFGPLAAKDGSAPRYEGGRCSATYCHGATLAGGAGTAPAWTGGAAEVASCQACHGAPPPEPHPQLADCRLCHGETVTSPTAIDVAGGKHVNGKVDAGHGAPWTDVASPGFHAYAANAGIDGCRSCHGDDLGGGSAAVACASCHGEGFRTRCTGCHGGTAEATGAPPRATWRNADARAVGAHAAHVEATHALAAPLDCAACHARPADALTPGHVDGAVAVTGYTGADPALRAAVGDPGYARSGADASCATSYCHGATLAGGSNRTPQWTRTDGTQAACGTCHGRPPATGPDVAGYPAHRYHTYRQNLGCGTCHDGYSQTAVAPATHVNGVRDVRVRHLVCAPAGCDPSADPACACTEQVSTVVGWDCGGCHSKFTF